MPPDHSKLLARIPLFQGLSAEDLSSIAALARTRHYRAKQMIVQQSDPGDDLFVIVNGHTKVVTSDAEGRDTALGIMGPSEVFGEVSLLEGAERSATIIALEPCEMLVIERAPFLEMLVNHPHLAIRLLTVLARRLRRLTERSEDIAFRNVAGRIAKALLQLADEYGRPEEGGRVRVMFRLSQQEIGDLIGATRESANKHIRHWEQKGIVSQEAGHLIIHDMDALRAVANRE